jgi:anion-transporting  ArsA/GET3 family ATPase
MSSLIADKKTLIVVGPSGVGKTTTSAALAVHAARMGLKVLVLTVDPARRLASSLGLKELGNQEVEIDPRLFEEAGTPLQVGPRGTRGRLFGMMLDVKSTFDGLVERYAPNDEVRRKILTNPFYVQGSSALAGSQEYMAMEKLYEIREQRDYDLIVLDTPPTSNALDFLRAADRLEDFLGSQTAKVLVQGAKAAGRFGLGFLKVNTFIMRGLNKFVGADMFLNVLEFIQSFHEMYAGFKQRAARVKEILKSPDVGFLVVSSTDSAAIDESVFFHEQLRRSGMPFSAMLVNRVRETRLSDADIAGLGDHLLAVSPPIGDRHALERVAAVAEEAARDWHVLAKVDALRLSELRTRFANLGETAPIVPIPLFQRDIHDIGALARYAEVVASALGLGVPPTEPTAVPTPPGE